MPSAAASSTNPLDLVLHIGMDKTGTSSIQFLLFENRERLRELGVLFPLTPGRTRHTRLGLFAMSEDEARMTRAWASQKQRDMASFRTVFRRNLLSEIEDSGLSRVLFTDEALFSLSEPALRRLRKFTNQIANSVRVVAYLRRQDDHMISLYQQQVKGRSVIRLRDWARSDMSSRYDYYARLWRIERLLAPTELVVRRYEHDSFVSGSLYQDFLDAAGIDTRADDLERSPDRNRSLDADSVEFLRLLNLYRVEYRGGGSGLIDNRSIATRLAPVSDGPILSLPAGTLDGFMAQWAATNEMVARRFLGDASGQLFRTPRRTQDITTEQRLDPDRLEHYFTMLELPEQVLAPVRQIAEREATDAELEARAPR